MSSHASQSTTGGQPKQNPAQLKWKPVTYSEADAEMYNVGSETFQNSLKPEEKRPQHQRAPKASGHHTRAPGSTTGASGRAQGSSPDILFDADKARAEAKEASGHKAWYGSSGVSSVQQKKPVGGWYGARPGGSSSTGRGSTGRP